MENPEKPIGSLEAQERVGGVETESSPEAAETQPSLEVPATNGEVATPAEAAPAPKVEMPVGPAPETKDPLRMQVERVLEDNLWDVYKALPEGARAKFRNEGERLAAELRERLVDPKATSGEIYGDVTAWLKTIPRVNPFFLAQEAKIKTDKWTKLRAEALETGASNAIEEL